MTRPEHAGGGTRRHGSVGQTYPVGVPVYSAIGYDILLPHALAASLPFELLILAFLILALNGLHPALPVLTGVAVVTTIAVGAWKMATARPARADYACHYVERAPSGA